MLSRGTALATGVRLTLEEFGTEFSHAWSRLAERFLKVECWQAYQELPDNRSQEAFLRGDVERAVALLRDEARSDEPLYRDVRDRGLDYARIRMVQEPLSEYLRYEILSYRIREALGEPIVVVRVDPGTVLPNDEFFDFLLFDQQTALIHDYGDGPVGAQTGGWLIQDRATIQALEETALALRARAIPLHRYLSHVTDHYRPSGT